MTTTLEEEVNVPGLHAAWQHQQGRRQAGHEGRGMGDRPGHPQGLPEPGGTRIWAWKHARTTSPKGRLTAAGSRSWRSTLPRKCRKCRKCRSRPGRTVETLPTLPQKVSTPKDHRPLATAKIPGRRPGIGRERPRRGHPWSPATTGSGQGDGPSRSSSGATSHGHAPGLPVSRPVPGTSPA